jgi:hypothetical protein
MLLTLAELLPQTRPQKFSKDPPESHSVVGRLNIKFDARLFCGVSLSRGGAKGRLGDTTNNHIASAGRGTVTSNFGGFPLQFRSQFDYATHGSILRAGLNYSLDLAVPVRAKN